MKNDNKDFLKLILAIGLVLLLNILATGQSKNQTNTTTTTETGGHGIPPNIDFFEIVFN